MRRRRTVPAGQACNALRTSRDTWAGAVGAGTKGGGLLVWRLTSERVASVTPTATAAAAIAAAPTTSQTRSRGLIRARPYRSTRRYICESDADVQGIAATGARRDHRSRRRACARAARYR